MNEVFEFASEDNVSLKNNFLKLKRPFRNTNTGQKALSFTGHSFWNQIPETLKKTDNLNTFKHNLKKHFFNQMTWFLLTLPLLLILLFIAIIIKSSNITIVITTVISTQRKTFFYLPAKITNFLNEKRFLYFFPKISFIRPKKPNVPNKRKSLPSELVVLMVDYITQ